MIVRDSASRLRFLVLVASLAVIVIASPAWARTQDSDRAAASSSGGTGTRLGGSDDDATGATASDQGGRTGEGESFLAWVIRGSGWIGLVIALMSFYLIALVVWMFLHYRMPVVAPGELIEDVEGLLDQARYNEAYHRLVKDESFLARVLAAGVRKLPAGLDQGRRAMELANEDGTMQMEHRTTYLATVGTLGPMIGLVGTVYGMILSFRVIAMEGASPQASDLARGISTALFATLEGIAISIPAIYFHALFRNRIARLSLEVGLIVEPLLRHPRLPTPTPSPSAPRWRPTRPHTAAEVDRPSRPPDPRRPASRIDPSGPVIPG